MSLALYPDEEGGGGSGYKARYVTHCIADKLLNGLNHKV